MPAFKKTVLSRKSWFLFGTLILFSCNAFAEKHVIEIEDFQFVPAVLEVKVGDTITWVNRDYAPHTATAEDDSWDTGNLEFKEKARIKVSAKTATEYYCRYHPNMKASLIILSE